MKRIIYTVTLGLVLLPLTACENKQQTGTLGGAVVGGLVGSTIGQGGGKTAAIIGGAVLGGLIGGHVGKQMDANDRRQAQQALESTPTGQAASWHNPDTGRNYTMTPTKTYKEPDSGQYCREYQTEVIVGGKTENAYGTACRQPDGSWKVADS